MSFTGVITKEAEISSLRIDWNNMTWKSVKESKTLKIKPLILHII